jgi:undecaprenyl-diphosphatase
MKRIYRFSLFLFACLLFGLILKLASTKYPAAFDIDILTVFSNMQTPALNVFFGTITWLGSFYIIIPVSLVAGYILYSRQQRIEVLFFSTGIISAIVITQLLKNLIARQRPDMYPALTHTFSSLSFPSAHAAQISALCLSVFLICRPRQRMQRVLFATALCLLVFGVMLSRLYLQVHYPTDVLGGMLLGLICVAGSSLIYRRT